MDFTKSELMFLAAQFPEKSGLSLLTNLKAELLGTEAEGLEKKGIYRGGELREEARELLEIVAGASNSARILLQDQYVFVEKYVFRLGNKSVLVESNGEKMALNPLTDPGRVLDDLAQFTGLSRLKTVNLEIALLPEEMLVLLALVDIYRRNTLLFHAGEAELLESAALSEIAKALQNPVDNSFVRILTKNYGYPVPAENSLEEILKNLLEKGRLVGEKEYRLSEGLDVFARGALIPETLLLTELLQVDPAGEVIVGNGLAVITGIREIAYFILENDLVELSTLSGRQLLQVIENFLKCPDLPLEDGGAVAAKVEAGIDEAEHENAGSPVTAEGRLPMGSQFAALQEEYDKLNDLAQAGAISLQEFQEKVSTLRFQDNAGIWWQLCFDGVWLKWDGENWVEAEPRISIAGDL